MEQEKDIPETTDEVQFEEDVVTESEDRVSDEENAQASDADEGLDVSPEKLHLLLEDARAKADEHWELLVRSKAETDNLKKRHSRELENAHKYAIDKFVNELLPVRDSLELGLNAGKEAGAEISTLLEGTELTLKLLVDVLSKFGIEEINPEGEAFDPDFHQAMSMQPVEGVESNTVVTVIQKGYRLNGRLIRPAMVMVAQ